MDNAWMTFRKNIDAIERKISVEVPTSGNGRIKRRFNGLRRSIITVNIEQTLAHLQDILNIYSPNDDLGREYKNLMEKSLTVQTIELNRKKVVFLSHRSNDKEYADILYKAIMAAGINRDQLIYTSHADHAILLNGDIYESLRDGITKDSLMVILWSDDYFQSPICICETGAAWAVGCETVNAYVPQLQTDDARFNKVPLELRKQGIVLDGSEICKRGLLRLTEMIRVKFNVPSKDCANELFDPSISRPGVPVSQDPMAIPIPQNTRY